MIGTVTAILYDLLTKMTSIALKHNTGDITIAGSGELLHDLVQNTARRIHERRLASFITDN